MTDRVADDLTAAPLSTEQERAAAAGTWAYSSEEPPHIPADVPAWHLHRRMYDWVVGFANKTYGPWALGIISFTESSFFPIPPDVLLAPMCLGRPRRALWFAALTTATSVLGAMLGYAIGAFAWGATQGFLYDYIPGFTPEKFQTVQRLYDDWGVLVLFAAAFTPIPFKIFTIAGGVFAQPFLPFVLVSIVGRGARFFLVAGLLWWIGPKATPFIDKYFNWLALAFVALAVAGFAALKLLH